MFPEQNPFLYFWKAAFWKRIQRKGSFFWSGCTTSLPHPEVIKNSGWFGWVFLVSLLQQQTLWGIQSAIIHFLVGFQDLFYSRTDHSPMPALFNSPACPAAQFTPWYILILTVQVNYDGFLLSGFQYLSLTRLQGIFTRQRCCNSMNLKLHHFCIEKQLQGCIHEKLR